jgi:hypothetical protein
LSNQLPSALWKAILAGHAPCRFLACAVLLTAFGCAGSESKPVWVEASDSNLPASTTFGWENGDAEPIAIVDRNIRTAIRAQLLARGYEESTENPDFLMDYETLEKDAIERGNPVRIGIGVGSYGGNVGGRVGTSVDVGEKDKVVQQLRISIHALDPERDREIWAGTTTALPERPDAPAVERAIAELMVGFPARNHRD